jgi:hypothetical protein
LRASGIQKQQRLYRFRDMRRRLGQFVHRQLCKVHWASASRY